MTADMVNHPPHYKMGGIECIAAIRAALTPEEFRGYCKGNAIKYVWRERHKGKNESLEKAVWYLNEYTGGQTEARAPEVVARSPQPEIPPTGRFLQIPTIEGICEYDLLTGERKYI